MINLARDPDGLTPFTTGKGTFDILYECSGSPIALTAGIHAMRPRGTILQLGLGGDMTLPMMALTSKELDLRGSFRFHEEFHTAVSLMRKGLIDVKPLITGTRPLSEANKPSILQGTDPKASRLKSISANGTGPSCLHQIEPEQQ